MGTELTRLDQELLKMASDGLSAQEMAARTGEPAAKALLRVKEILRERDWATEVEKRAMLMDDLYDLKRKVQDQQKDMEFLSDKQIVAMAKVIETIDTLMEKQGKINDDLLHRVTTAQSTAMLRLIEHGFQRALTALALKYSDLPRGELQEAFQTGLKEAGDLLE